MRENTPTEDKEKKVGWFYALGDEISQEQRDMAVQEARNMGLDVPDDAPWVNKVANYVEADRPKEAIDLTREYFDLTGTYRFLAYLCVPLEAYEETEQDGDDNGE